MSSYNGKESWNVRLKGVKGHTNKQNPIYTQTGHTCLIFTQAPQLIIQLKHWILYTLVRKCQQNVKHLT